MPKSYLELALLELVHIAQEHLKSEYESKLRDSTISKLPKRGGALRKQT